MPPDPDPDQSARPRRLIIVPVFNEQDSVCRVVEGLGALPGYDVLVIDDGSTDDTTSALPPGVPVIRLPFNLGIGGAMQTGYRYAAKHGYDVAVQVDGDGQHPPGEVHRVVEKMNETGADMVVGSRFISESRYQQSLSRRLGSRALRFLIRVLTGRDITDCTSGFRAVNRGVIRAFAHWYPEDYPEPEVILLLHRAGYRVEEAAVRMAPRTGGQTSIPLHRGVFYVIKVSACLVLDMIRTPWPKSEVTRT